MLASFPAANHSSAHHFVVILSFNREPIGLRVLWLTKPLFDDRALQVPTRTPLALRLTDFAVALCPTESCSTREYFWE